MENIADSDPEEKPQSRREQTAPFRINKKTVDSLKEFQAQFGERGPSLADLVETAWDEYVKRHKGEDPSARLRPEDRQLMDRLIRFLAGKSPMRRVLTDVVERMLQEFMRERSKLVWILLASGGLVHYR